MRTGTLQRAKGKPLVKVSTRNMDMVLELENEAARDYLVDNLNPLVQQVQDACQPKSRKHFHML